MEPEPCPAGEWGSGGCWQAYQSWRSRYQAPQEAREATQMSRAVEEPVSAEWVGPVPRVPGWPERGRDPPFICVFSVTAPAPCGSARGRGQECVSSGQTHGFEQLHGLHHGVSVLLGLTLTHLWTCHDPDSPVLPILICTHTAQGLTICKVDGISLMGACT